jgi:hypothetical protein
VVRGAGGAGQMSGAARTLTTSRVAPVRCALFTTFRYDWAASILLSTPNVSWHALESRAIPVDTPDDPFALSITESVDVAMVSTPWYKWLALHHSEQLDAVFDALRRRSRVIVGLDSGDEFALSLPPEAFDYCDIVLKPQGIYRDLELFNYEVGPLYPGGNWTHKIEPRARQYSSAALDKLRLSVPCIMLDLPAIRRDARRREATDARTLTRSLPATKRLLHNLVEQTIDLANPHVPIGHRPQDVHCLVQLSHIQRLEALEILSDFSGMKGIVGTDRSPQGTKYGWRVPAEELEAIRKRAAGFSHPPLRRPRFLYELSRHKIGVAPTGYGELGQRHAAVMLAGAALVCQDLSHVEMLFPIEDGLNAAFCKPDLSDLRDVVHELLLDDERRLRIARHGREQLVKWGRNWRKTLYDAVEKPLVDALGSS